jgi:alpha-glucosidase
MNPNDWRWGGVTDETCGRGFADPKGGGTGDLAGLTARWPYVRDSGANRTWRTPLFQSPMRDFGHDITAYRADPPFGSLAGCDPLAVTDSTEARALWT